jgi:16S rRNA (uracil1498-N3)-methyltransferase
MQRYFIPAEQFHETFVQITGDDAHHLLRVMRAQAGDRFICSNGEDREALVEITETDKSSVTASIIELLPVEAEPAVDVWIAQSLPKGDKMETVIQKSTEIGAARFIPFLSERTIVQYDAKKEAKRTGRWQKIAKEAAEQAHRNRVPQVEAPCSWQELLKRVADADAAWICYEKESGSMFKDALREWSDGQSGERQAKPKLLLLIGPEGGFSEREVAEAEAAGCRPVSLGKRILRTETAAMVGLTCILYECGEMGG